MSRTLLFALLWLPAGAQNRIDSLGRSFIQQSGHVNLSIGVYCRGKVFFYGYGQAVKGRPVPPGPGTIYEIGSLTKTFTAYLLARAVMEGRVRLDDPVTRYIGDADPGLRGITLRELASHTAGMPKFIPPLDRATLATAAGAAKYPVITVAAFLQALRSFRPDTVPGTRFNYSNVDAQLLGILLSRLYHRSYAQLLHQYILGPAGMNDTWLNVPASQRGREVGQYDAGGQAMPYAHFWDDLPATASIKSTAGDLVRYMRFCLDTTDAALRLCREVNARNTGEHDADIGLYWFVRRAPAGALPGAPAGAPVSPTGDLEMLHGGGLLGSTSFCLLDPGRQAGVICLAGDASPGCEDALAAMAEQIIQTVSSSRD
jgi:CubicO group peptidase (beta-lactamase class C family)